MVDNTSFTKILKIVQLMGVIKLIVNKSQGILQYINILTNPRDIVICEYLTLTIEH